MKKTDKKRSSEEASEFSSAKKKKKKKRKTVKRILLAVLILFLLCASVIAGALFGFIDNSTDLIADEYNLEYSSVLYYYDENNYPQELDTLYSEQNRIWVDIENTPENLKNAFIAIEDERFLKHRGVDWKRTFGAFLNFAVRGNKSYGGSTITQQLIKNITGDDERSPIRKIQEIVRALNLEKKLTKDQIIEMYMNTIYLGEGCHGVQTASNVYFSKDVSELTLEECATIAGITQYPTRYDPLINYEASKEKQEVVLNKMAELGFITAEQCETAKNTELVLHKGTAKLGNDNIQSSFTDQVIEDVIKDLIEINHMSESAATKELYKGGLKVYTTADMKVQNALEDIYNDDSNFPRARGNVQPQSAAVIIDPSTGYIKGMVGQRGEKTGNRVLNRATHTLRQAGSTIKPIGVYAPAIEYGVANPATIVKDAPVKIGEWEPKNSDNTFLGRITMRKALEKSRNVCAIRVANAVGAERSYDFLEKNLGISTLVKSEKRSDGKVYSDKVYSSLALGGLTDGISVLELAAAYVPFANKGMYIEPITYTKVVDSRGKTILEKTPEKKQAMSEITAYSMANMMTGVIKFGTGTSAALSSTNLAAGKTGTTDTDIDRWFAGFTPYYVGVVWFGYDQPKAMTGLGNPCTNVWRKVMNKIHTGLEPKQLDIPANAVKLDICQVTGNIATSNCYSSGNVRTEYFSENNKPTDYCYSHAVFGKELEDNLEGDWNDTYYEPEVKKEPTKAPAEEKPEENKPDEKPQTNNGGSQNQTSGEDNQNSSNQQGQNSNNEAEKPQEEKPGIKPVAPGSEGE